MPLFVRANATIPVYPLLVAHTGEMADGGIRPMAFDASYTGLATSVLAPLLAELV